MVSALTLDLETSASMLGTQPETLLEYVQSHNLPGILFFADQPQFSIFTLAQLLNTQPEILLDWLEDEGLAQMIEEVDDDEWFEGQDSQATYQSILANESQ